MPQSYWLVTIAMSASACCSGCCQAPSPISKVTGPVGCSSAQLRQQSVWRGEANVRMFPPIAPLLPFFCHQRRESGSLTHSRHLQITWDFGSRQFARTPGIHGAAIPGTLAKHLGEEGRKSRRNKRKTVFLGRKYLIKMPMWKEWAKEMEYRESSENGCNSGLIFLVPQCSYLLKVAIYPLSMIPVSFLLVFKKKKRGF